ncbi:L,D-transpeptidase family protein [Rhodobacteraceae bacterium D3-12]|nr:L,D-transpeptidase family protein [Rhodobacteraceae bacterium D3-12]
MRWLLGAALLGVALGAGALAYANAARHMAPAQPPAMAPAGEQADAITVHKAARRLVLLRNGVPIRSYAISLGADPSGPKAREGDERTPEGTYVIDWRNARSIAHLSLHISYPNAADVAAAKAAGVSAGGDIMIHGLPNGWGAIGALHRLWDWTDGCIGLTNAEMSEVWSLVPDGTPITIYND